MNITMTTAEGVTLTFDSVDASDLPEVMTIAATMTPKASAPAKKKATKSKPAPKGRKTGSKSRKSTGSKTRTVRSANLAAFGEAAGYDSLEGWTLEEFLLHLLTSGEAESRWNWMPKGWAFGPASEHFLANGNWPS